MKSFVMFLLDANISALPQVSRIVERHPSSLEEGVIYILFGFIVITACVGTIMLIVNQFMKNSLKRGEIRQTDEGEQWDDVEQNGKRLTDLHTYLDFNIIRLNLQGTATLFISIALGLIMYLDIKTAINWQLMEIDNATNPTQVLAFLIFRSSALGIIATSLLYFGSRMTIASFDQAMRFTKRKMGTTFLEFLYDYHGNKLRTQNVSLIHIMTSFEVWNRNVESAFSNIKTERGDNGIEALMKLSKRLEGQRRSVTNKSKVTKKAKEDEVNGDKEG